MELLTLLLTILNTILIVLLGLKYFNDNYTIVSLQDWNKVANFYNAHYDEYDDKAYNTTNTLVDDDNGEPIPEEKAGGCGFFHDQIEEIDDDEQEE